MTWYSSVPTVRLSWLDLVGAGTLLAVAALIFSSYGPDDPRRWLALLDMATMSALLLWKGAAPRQERREHLRLTALTLLMVGLVVLQANITGLIVIGIVASGAAMSVLPPRQGYRWIVVFAAVIMLAAVLSWGYRLPALLVTLGCFAGYLLVGLAVDAQRRAEAAQAESQRLASELQAAQRQLQGFAHTAEALDAAEKRNRLARELHDTLAHRLTAAAVQLNGAQRLVTLNPDKARHMIGAVRKEVREGVDDLRRVETV